VVRHPGAWSNLFRRFDVSTLHHPSGGFPLDPQSEANELREIGAPDVSPTLGSPGIRDAIDVLWVAEMERRDRRGACPAGYREAPCEACGAALFVPVTQPADVLCDACRAAGEAAAAAVDDDDPRPPAAGALHPDYPEFAASAARMLDDELCTAIGIADAEPAAMRLVSPEQRQAFVGALSAEVVRRLEGRRAA
jgi:hypothetical protein